MKGFQACDDETVKDYIQKADELITKVKKDKDELIDKEVAGDGDEDLPKTKTGRLTINAPFATKVVCFPCLLKCLRSLYGKQCGPRSDCSYRSSLFWVHTVCFYTCT